MADPNLKIRITALNKTQQAFNSVQGGLRRVSKAVFSLKGGLAALGSGVALRGFAKSIDELAKSSARLGLTVNQIQSLQFAASQTGASSEELEKGLTRFSRAVSEANTGIGTGLRAFEMLGVKITDASDNIKPTRQLLDEVSDALTQIENPADRVRVAFDLFGRSGVNLVNTLQQGSKNLKELGDEFNAVTITLTQEQAKAVEEANDLFDKLGRTFSSIGQQITANVLPKLAKLSQFLTVNVMRGLAGVSSAVRGFLNGIVDLAKKAGIEMNKFTFGEAFEKQIERITFNIENAGKAFMDMSGHVSLIVENTKKQNEKTSKQDQIMANLTKRLNGATFAFEQFKFETVELNQETQKLNNELVDVASRGLSSMEDGLVGLVKGTKSVSDAFRDMANSIIEDLIRMQIKKSITEPLFAGIQSFLLPAGNPTGVPTFMAKGGNVTSGRPYIVGEKGAELFVPNRSGAIVPNDKLGGGSSPVVVNQTINLSTGVSQTVRTEVLGMLPQISEAAKSAVLDAKRRGGQFSSVFGV